jgi:hypothetical protein
MRGCCKKLGRVVTIGNCSTSCDSVASHALLHKQAGVILVFCADTETSPTAREGRDEARRSERSSGTRIHLLCYPRRSSVRPRA